MTRRSPELTAALKAADRRVSDAARSPGGRLRLREAFYLRDPALESYSRSELAFLRYEIDRGVLGRGGSAWWRTVNRGLLRDAERAAAWFDAKTPPDRREPAAVGFWFDFLSDPTDAGWYRAHNGSVARAALEARELAKAETAHERHFLGEVLDRVLFAHSLCAGKAGEFGAFVADPESVGVELLLKDPELYPREYPAPRDTASMLERMLDLVIGVYRVPLYTWAAGVLRLPELAALGVHRYPG